MRHAYDCECAECARALAEFEVTLGAWAWQTYPELKHLPVPPTSGQVERVRIERVAWRILAHEAEAYANGRR